MLLLVLQLIPLVPPWRFLCCRLQQLQLLTCLGSMGLPVVTSNLHNQWLHPHLWQWALAAAQRRGCCWLALGHAVRVGNQVAMGLVFGWAGLGKRSRMRGMEHRQQHLWGAGGVFE